MPRPGVALDVGAESAAPYGRTVRLARQSHRFYSTLVRTYDAHGYNAKVDRITRRQLDRAANAAADLVSAMA